MGAAAWRGARPDVERGGGLAKTHTLFFCVLLLALLIVMVPATVLAHATHVIPAVALGAVLATSWWYGYRRGRTSVLSDFADAAGLAAFVLVLPVPTSVLSITFALVWFRSTYGSTARALARTLLFAAALFAALLVWPTLHGTATTGPAAAAIYSATPMVLLNTGIMRLVTRTLRRQDEANQREAVVAALGADLLSATDTEHVLALARAALADVCTATPSLSLVAVVDGDGRVEPVESWGPAVDLPAGPGERSELVARGRRSWGWVRMSSAPRTESRVGWILVAGPHRVAREGFAAVRAVVHQAALAVRNVQSRELLFERAHTDGLTGLANRAAFEERVEHAGETFDPEGHVLLFIDLDGFKTVNDTLGHAAGDALLCEIAERLLRSTRPADVCARLGGDEFAVLLSGVDVSVARAVAERIVRTVAEPVLLDGTLVSVGASVGLAHSASVAGTGQLLRAADVAMYAAKAAGKGCVQLHDAPGVVTGARDVLN